jgi:lipoprotein-anchoring transpeptidase ErfK/SrfK
MINKSKEEKKGKRRIISLLKEAEDALAEGNLLEAKRLYKEAMSDIDDINKLKEVRKKLEDINMKIIFSPILDECSIEYIVKPNDALVKIAKKFKTTVNLIKKANNLKSDIIKPQDKLKINTCEFSIVIDKSQNLLFLKRKGEVIKTYIVATGKNNSTPTGNFKIVNKLMNPTWFKTGAVIPPDSPENILGSRWMGFDIKGYGIHGTAQPQTLGKQTTMGCIRMSNEDVEELFDLIPVGTEVIIID